VDKAARALAIGRQPLLVQYVASIGMIVVNGPLNDHAGMARPYNLPLLGQGYVDFEEFPTT